MYLDKIKIQKLEKVNRINLINSITGIKPVLLVGTQSEDYTSNLAIFSSIVHISSKPPLLGFFLRNNKKVRRDTLENIIYQRVYTLNHIHTSYVKNAHYTSIKFAKEISEFEKCNFTEKYLEKFSAPFVQESDVRLGMLLQEIIDLKSSASKLLVGRIEHIFVNDKFLENDFTLNLEETDSVSISGLNHYYTNKKLIDFPYARSTENFKL